MTLQQLQYIVAIAEHRHFVRAADACGVTQSTLSSLVKSLENELDAVIFDRKAHPVRPTEIGEKIIEKARVVLFNAEQLSEMTAEEKGVGQGKINMGIIPTVSPYLLPGIVRRLAEYPGLSIKFSEARTEAVVDALKKAEIDIGILATPLHDSELLEIPVYHEKFYAYVTPGDPLYDSDVIDPRMLPGDNLWVLQEGHCFRNQIEGFCELARKHSAVYESGSIDTLLRVLDMNGGHTIIPQMHLEYLSDLRMKNVRKIGMPEPEREISLVIRKDYVRERFLNIISDIIKTIVPDDMLDSRIKKFKIRL